MPLIDFHCHLADAGGYQALEGETTLFEEPTLVVAVTNRPSDWRALRGRGTDRVVWSVGLHPQLRHPRGAIDRFLQLLPESEMIGEIGLDYSREANTSRATQRSLFNDILRSPEATRRLLTIHSRAATADVLAGLADHQPPGAILHWFLGSSSEIEDAIDLDVYFSVNAAMLASTRGKAVISALPPNRVVLETDAPYGGSRGKPSIPGDVGRLVPALGRTWGLDPDEAINLIVANQRNLLRRVEITPEALRRAV